ncbi:MAG: COX15/CtaA family protein [Deltaproteobacteria bacterium]|nr:COX15/CtaA family protein [Deltaproteobacteria bacterium]
MKKILWMTIGLTFLLIVWGGIVRNSGAGLACPDWPLCHGKIIPPLETLILLEWGHRLIASFVVLFTFLVVLFGIGSQKYRRLIGEMALITFFLLIVQALLGALTVKYGLGPQFVTLHLAVAWIFLALLLWMYLVIARPAGPKQSPGGGIAEPVLSEVEGAPRNDRKLALLATVLVYGQGVLGAYVGSSHAGLACPDFPTCFGRWIPTMTGGIPYQFAHRMVAFLVLATIIGLVTTGFQAPIEKCFRSLLWGILSATILQISFGIGNVLLRLPPWMSVAHLGVGTALFAMLVVVTYILTHERKNAGLSPTH